MVLLLLSCFVYLCIVGKHFARTHTHTHARARMHTAGTSYLSVKAYHINYAPILDLTTRLSVHFLMMIFCHNL